MAVDWAVVEKVVGLEEVARAAAMAVEAMAEGTEEAARVAGMAAAVTAVAVQ